MAQGWVRGEENASSHRCGHTAGWNYPLRPPQVGDGSIVNAAIVESYDVLKLMMPWAQTIPSVDESEEYARQAAANRILKKDEEPYLPLWIFRLLKIFEFEKPFIPGKGF
jgi:hypothetical protein